MANIWRKKVQENTRIGEWKWVDTRPQMKYLCTMLHAKLDDLQENEKKQVTNGSRVATEDWTGLRTEHSIQPVAEAEKHQAAAPSWLVVL